MRGLDLLEKARWRASHALRDELAEHITDHASGFARAKGSKIKQFISACGFGRAGWFASDKSYNIMRYKERIDLFEPSEIVWGAELDG